jgi:hypothetical protein
MPTPAEVLTIAFNNDPAAIHAVVAHRVPCNQQLADDEFVIVAQNTALRQERYHVGALGLVNAVLESLGQPLVAAQWETTGDGTPPKLVGFAEFGYPVTDNKGSDTDG